MQCAQRLLSATSVLGLSALSLWGQSASPVPSARLLRDQHFVCNTGYTQSACHEQIQQFAVHLAAYSERLPSDWTWVLVRSQDWHEILLRLNLDPASPAFTVLGQRRTFVSEALVAPDARGGAELLRTFKIPLDHILDVAITHELGHAYCHDEREAEADRFGRLLRSTGAAQCALPGRSSTRDSVSTMRTPR